MGISTPLNSGFESHLPKNSARELPDSIPFLPPSFSDTEAAVEIRPSLALPLLLLFAAGSFFFALAESALFSLGLWRARQLATSDPVRGPAVVRLLERSQDVLGTLVLGNSFANGMLVTLGVLLAQGGGWTWLTAVLVVLATLLLACEVTPKALGVRQPELWAARVARPLEALVRVSSPFRRLGQALVDRLLGLLVPRSIKPVAPMSDDEYADLVELAHQQGALETTEKETLLAILSLDEKTARDVMRPRSQLVMLPDTLSPKEMAAVARRTGLHRLPLYDETPDNIVGLLNSRTLLLNPESDLFEAVEFPSFVPESTNLLRLFESLQRQHRGLAIVLDEFGGVAGMVTLRDILATVVGEFRATRTDAAFSLTTVGPGVWKAGGGVRIDDFRRHYPALGEVEDVDTLAGLVLKLAEVVPDVGMAFTFRGLRLTVKDATERRIRELLVEALNPGATP